MTDFGLVSIITPTYNSETYIKICLDSILNQTYQNWELLITDDGSSDSTCEIIESYIKKDSRINLFKLNKNFGAGYARNNSIKNAKGRYIAFCDSDDRWFSKKLELQLAFMIEKKCSLSYTSYEIFNENGCLTGYVECPLFLTMPQITKGNTIGCLTAIYDAENIGKQYMPVKMKSEDWCLWIKIISICKIAYGLQKPLAGYMDRRDSYSSNKLEMLKYNYKVYKEILKNNRLYSIFNLFFRFMPNYIYRKLSLKKDFKVYNKNNHSEF